MQIVKTKGEIDAKGRLHLDVTTKMPAGPVDLTLVLESCRSQSNGSKYDFTELAGKLSWEGDAVVAQRKLRDEW